MFKSEYKLKQYLSKNDLYSEPMEFIINNSCTPDEMLNISKESPKVFQSMQTNLEKVNNQSEITNICSGSVWKNKIDLKFDNKCVIPYLVYQDDFEINNPLGSKSGVQKLSAVYITFPLLNSEDISKLNNIFVACLTRSSSLEFGLAKNFGPLCSLLKNLEENGIQITINSKPKRVYLILSALVGDNLGLNTIMGFTRSFSANFFCRICRSHKDEMKKQTVENKLVLRTAEDYWQHLFQNDVSQTGIKEMCVFNAIPSFRAADNISVDIMHDIFEGICHVELCQILNCFVYDKKYFTLSILNNRKANFQYHRSDYGNKSVSITVKNLNSNKLKMSASEMQCFLHHLPLLVGELVPVKDPVWACLLLLIKLTNLCFLPSYNENTLNKLQNTIKNHHELYLDLFQKELTPKHHFVVHYPNVIRKLGPLKGLWVMRQEAKHKQAKLYLNNIACRKNVLMSAAIKWQFNLAGHLHSLQMKYQTDLLMGEYFDLSEKVFNVNFDSIEFNSNLLKNVLCCSKVHVNSVYYINVLTLVKIGLAETKLVNDHIPNIRSIKIDR
ncbi:hypothetical protein PPYR_05574 [Photinus pyralis]|uniref:Uncharacterized protein n=1 Tax=Photinus pyralis TaxID=7054 RepID=A0A5N4AVH1_PHOPY|nr:hypothetical protein PPYR_05574 [Photinus pyralis]